MQYAIGDVDFLHSKILVDERVLVPRFETELLLVKLIGYIRKYNFDACDILDICTGSGCIAISLKKEFESSRVSAFEKSTVALEVAKMNANINGVDIEFVECDILKEKIFDKKYSIVVSNPPYVKLDEIVSSNTKFEPAMALYPGEDDILFYKRILDESKGNLLDKFIIAFEIGSSQATKIVEYAKNLYENANIVVEKDYNNYDRFVFIFNNCE